MRLRSSRHADPGGPSVRGPHTFRALALLLALGLLAGAAGCRARRADPDAGVLYVVLVCHVESDPWNGRYTGMQYGLPAMRAVFRRISTLQEAPLRTTFCVNPSAARDAALATILRDLLAEGHELGLHSQGGTDPPGRPHRNLGPADNERRIPEDARELAALGFPAPRTYAAGNFAYLPTTTRVLERAGIEISCSALPGLFEEGAYDYRRLLSFAPYHPDYSDNSLPGSATLLEIPVSAALASLKRQGGNEGEMPEMTTVWPPAAGSYAEVSAHLRKRLAAVRATSGVDIFEVVWHPWEAVTKLRPDWPSAEGNLTLDLAYLERVEKWLGEIAGMRGLRFDTASAAAAAWQQAKKSQ
jgi:hypothetical protein